MRQDFDILRTFEPERIAVIILRNMVTAFRNVPLQIAAKPNTPSLASIITSQNVPNRLARNKNEEINGYVYP
jgi:hypothetical protein